ncbi:MAG: toprim domain-containing protein, partial [Candidatus Anstonellales archaeon]
KIETIKEFKIGFAPDGNYISKNYTKILQSKNKNYDLAALYKAGIINFKQEQKSSNSLEKYDYPYDYFRDRITFPIFNFNGKVVGFGGRILPEKLIDKDIPVYLNSAENILFNKGSILFWLYQAKEHIRKEKKVVVVEGYMDVLLLSQEGIKVVVAPLGTALTQQQVNLLKKFQLERIYLLFDPDDAGVEAAFSASKNVLEASEYPYIVKLDEEIDPDEYVLKHGKEKMMSLIENSTSIVKFIVDKYGYKEKNKLSVADKISLLKKFIELINVISNPVVKSEIIKEVAEELRIEENIVRAECKRNIQKKNNSLSFEQLINNRPYTCEEELLRICVHYPEFVEKLDEEIFSHDENYLDIFKKLKSIYLVSKDINEVLMSLNEANKNLVLRLVFDEKPPLDSLEKKYDMLCCEILKVKYKKRLKELKPIIDKMLEENKNINLQILNEYKQILEILKTKHREKRYG